MHDINPSLLSAAPSECHSNQAQMEKLLFCCYLRFLSLKKIKRKEKEQQIKKNKKQKHVLKIPPKKPAASLIIMEENLDGDVFAIQEK